MNKVTLLGNLTRDPEVRFTKSNKAVVNASIAVNERFKTEAGEVKEIVTFVDLVIWGKTGETFADYHTKGSRVLVDGKLIVEQWEKNGEKRRTTKVQVAAWHSVGAKTEAKPAAPKPTASPEATATEPAEDDVPF